MLLVNSKLSMLNSPVGSTNSAIVFRRDPESSGDGSTYVNSNSAVAPSLHALETDVDLYEMSRVKDKDIHGIHDDRDQGGVKAQVHRVVSLND